MKFGKSLLFLIFIVFFSCSTENIINEINNNLSDLVSSDQYVDVKVNLPDMGRGWTISKYSVTASKSGESSVTEETTKTSVSMRLKTGSWTFVANAYDSNNNLIYQSASTSYTVSGVNSSITLMLSQQSGVMKVPFSAPTAIKNSLTKIVVTATPSVSGFETITATSSSDTEPVYLSGLLANVNYSIVVEGYIEDVIYAQTNGVSKKITDPFQVLSLGSQTLTQKKVTPPKFNKPSGSSFSSNTTITLSCDTSSVSYYYTTNGATPTTSSTKYSSGITVDSSWASGKTIKVIAVKSGLTNSEVVEVTYKFDAGMATPPTFSKAGGTYSTDLSITLKNNESSGTLKYSYNGSTWYNYSSALSVSGNGTTKTIYAKVTGVTSKEDSAVVSQTYTIEYQSLAAPTISPAAGTYFNTQKFTLSGPDGATIRYTTNGNTPTTSSTKYSAPFTLSASSTAYNIKAIAIKTGSPNSSVADFGSYTIIDSNNLKTMTKNASSIWEPSGLQTLNTGTDKNIYLATGLSAGKSTNSLYYLPTNISPSITVYKNDFNTPVSVTTNTGYVQFSTAGATTSDKFYFVITVSSKKTDIALALAQNASTVKPVTGITISPTSVSDKTIGQTQTFSVTYSPSGANFGKEVTWSTSKSTVVSLSGTSGDSVTGTIVGTGSATITATSKFDTTIKKSCSVTVSSATTITATVPSWIFNDNAVIFAEVTKSNSTKEWVSVTGSGTTASFTMDISSKKFQLVRCATGTTTPDWNVKTGSSAGRIFNITNVVTYVSGTNAYLTGADSEWSEYGYKDTMLATTYNTSYGQDIYFGYRVYDGSGNEIKEWETVAGTYTGESNDYNWYVIIPGIENGATISWKAFMQQNGNQSWMNGDNRSTSMGTNQISGW